MEKLILSTREIGSVSVFDIKGDPDRETLQEVVLKIQKKIRRHRIQRVILNLQDLNSIDEIGMRKLMAACLRPQKSLIYGASPDAVRAMKESYIPQSVKICTNEEDVAEDFGPFLLEKDDDKAIRTDEVQDRRSTIGYQVERRRSKRMHVAMPLELRLTLAPGNEIVTKAIITNISEGGLFCEYLDNHQAKIVEEIECVDGLAAEIKIPKCSNFAEEYHLRGVVLRKEFRKKQLGLAIKFVE